MNDAMQGLIAGGAIMAVGVIVGFLVCWIGSRL